jgi:hypothetical protein
MGDNRLVGFIGDLPGVATHQQGHNKHGKDQPDIQNPYSIHGSLLRNGLFSN